MKDMTFLSQVAHRPFPMPTQKWQFYQEWKALAFLHYEIDESLLRPFVPEKIEIDCFNGKAWVSLVCFKMESVQPKNLFPVAAVSNFDEINIRTYVRHKGRQGVYFISIEAGKKFSAFLSRRFSGLPYRYSNMNVQQNACSNRNTIFDDRLTLEYDTKPLEGDKSKLDLWLTERYAVFQDVGNEIARFSVHHAPWELEYLEQKKLTINYPRFQQLFDTAPDLAHYSSGVQVVTWPKNID